MQPANKEEEEEEQQQQQRRRRPNKKARTDDTDAVIIQDDDGGLCCLLMAIKMSCLESRQDHNIIILSILSCCERERKKTPPLLRQEEEQLATSTSNGFLMTNKSTSFLHKWRRRRWWRCSFLLGLAAYYLLALNLTLNLTSTVENVFGIQVLQVVQAAGAAAPSPPERQRAASAYPFYGGCPLQTTLDPSYYDYKNAAFPPRNNNIPIKSPDDYLLVRRLGAGKFSDVFEAVDRHRQLEEKTKTTTNLRKSGNGSSTHTGNARGGGGGSSSSSSTRDGYDNNNNNNNSNSNSNSIDPQTMVVLKCLKPVAEQKIKRELLVLQHASKLPNLARLLAIVVPPDYYSATAYSSSSSSGAATTAAPQPPHIPAATAINSNSTTTTSSLLSAASSTTSKMTNKHHQQQQQQQPPPPPHLQSMPTLVLEHAHGEWLCHPRANKNKLHNNLQQQNQQQQQQPHPNYLTLEEIRVFIFHLLVALDSLHAAGIMHRDVKPRNVLINRHHRTLMLIDLGLADFYFAPLPLLSTSTTTTSTTMSTTPEQQQQQQQKQQKHKYNVRVASRHYKSPELLLGYQEYGTAIDIWGVGCMLAGLLLRKEPFFRGKDNLDQLAVIVAVLGTADLHLYIQKYKIEITPDIRKVIAKVTLQGGRSKRSWMSFLETSLTASTASSTASTSDTTATTTTTTSPIISPDGLDLLSKLLRYDHEERLTAKEAMQHPFFDSVRTSIERDLLLQEQQREQQQREASLLDSSINHN